MGSTEKLNKLELQINTISDEVLQFLQVNHQVKEESELKPYLKKLDKYRERALQVNRQLQNIKQLVKKTKTKERHSSNGGQDVSLLVEKFKKKSKQ